MIRGKFLTSADDIAPIIELRHRVFCDEQGYSPESEPDEFDRMSVYAAVYDDDGRVIGTGRLYVDDDMIKIGRVCVDKEWRGKQVGDFVMRLLLYRAQDLHAGSVTLSAQIAQVGFYHRYGFEPVGDIVYDEGQPHRVMRVQGDMINIEGTCHCPDGQGGCGGNCEECAGKA